VASAFRTVLQFFFAENLARRPVVYIHAGTESVCKNFVSGKCEKIIFKIMPEAIDFLVAVLIKLKYVLLWCARRRSRTRDSKQKVLPGGLV